MQVLRSKGFMWLAGRNDMSGDWSSAGAVMRVRCGDGLQGAPLRHHQPTLSQPASLRKLSKLLPAGVLEGVALSLQLQSHCGVILTLAPLPAWPSLCSVGGPWFAAIPEELWPDVDVSVSEQTRWMHGANNLPCEINQCPNPPPSPPFPPFPPPPHPPHTHTPLQPDKVKEDFEPGTGDRRQELVFIGIGVKASSGGRRPGGRGQGVGGHICG
jgi:G3E family GTPase